MIALTAVPTALLEAIVAKVPDPKPSLTRKASGSRTAISSRLDVERWLTDRGVAYRRKPERDNRGRTVYVLEECPFNHEHGHDSCVMQDEDGKLSAYCFHNGCAGHGWQEFKAKIGPPEPEHWNPPLKARHKLPTESTKVSDKAVPEAQHDRAHDEAKRNQKSKRDTIYVSQNVTVEKILTGITASLLESNECYRRANQVVRIAEIDATPVPIIGAAEMAGLFSLYAEICFVREKSSEYKPLPTSYGNTWLNNPEQTNQLPEIGLYTRNPVYTPDWRLSPVGYDPESKIYYAGSVIEPRAGTTHLDALLGEFCFKSIGDRTNFVGVLLTMLLMPHFIGSKPAILFNGNQPGLGKSILAQILSILRDGRPCETASYNPNDEEFEKRLGAIVLRGATTIIVDNAKGRGRAAKIESACLERSITDPVLSYRLLGHSKEIRAENSHFFCITANSPEVSRDLITRSVMVNLFYEGDPTRRKFSLSDPEDYAITHRKELLGELISMVEQWKNAGRPRTEVASRFNKRGWGQIIGGILQTCGYAGFLANAEEAAQELDESRREFAMLVTAMSESSQTVWTAAELVRLADSNGLFPDVLNNSSQRSQSTKFGLLAGRYIGESFTCNEKVIFERFADRKGALYRLRTQTEATAP